MTETEAGKASEMQKAAISSRKTMLVAYVLTARENAGRKRHATA